MSRPMRHMGLSGAQCFNVARPINLRPPNKPVQSKIFLLKLNHHERAKFIDTHKKKDHFSVMSMSEFDGTAFVDNDTVLEVFYKKTHKEQYCKSMWLTLYNTLTEYFNDPSSPSLQMARKQQGPAGTLDP